MPQGEQEQESLAEPDLIYVTVTHSEEIFADRANLYVTIKGSSLVAGTAALTKALEVKQLVTALTEAGLGPSDIRLQDVQAEVSTGFLGKSSSANYQLKIHCADLERLVEILGIITGQKNTKLHRTEWSYSADNELENGGLRDQWLDACLRRANAKADRIASALNVSLLGVRRFTEAYLGGSDYAPQAALARSKGGGSSMDYEALDMGMNISHSKWITFRVEVAYRVSGLPGERTASAA